MTQMLRTPLCKAGVRRRLRKTSRKGREERTKQNYSRCKKT